VREGLFFTSPQDSSISSAGPSQRLPNHPFGRPPSVRQEKLCPPPPIRDGATIFEDDDKDVLTGSSGSDWFFFDLLEDRATDLKDEIIANDLEFILSD
jgi:hypothetical protein